MQAQQASRPLIAHVVHRFAIGGLENGVVNLINRLPAQRWRHAIIALTDVAPDFARRITRDDVEFIELHKPDGHLLSQYPRLHRLFRTLAPNIVHTRNLAALEAAVPAMTAGVPIRIHGEHGWDVNDLGGVNTKYRWLRRIYSPAVQHWITMSKDLERYVVDRVGVPSRRVSQLYNGVDTKRFRPARPREMIPGSPFTDPSSLIVGTVGRLQAVKDQVNLVRAFVHATQSMAPIASRLRLVIAGDGPLRAAAEAVVRESGLTDRVWFAGERGDVESVMRGLDCFALPSLAEGISNTILEAMASGLPVVATRVGGNVELIEDGVTGRLVPSADSTALGQALIDVLTDPESASRMGKAARAHVEARFSLDRMVSDYDRIYSTLLPGRSMPVSAHS